jgi:hypothetical protein
MLCQFRSGYASLGFVRPGEDNKAHVKACQAMLGLVT